MNERASGKAGGQGVCFEGESEGRCDDDEREEEEAERMREEHVEARRSAHKRK